MANPRVRYGDDGQPKTCVVKIPPHLAQILYREALKARAGRGGTLVEESDIVIRLIERWAESLPAVDWPAVLGELRAEADAGARRAPARKAKKGRKG